MVAVSSNTAATLYISPQNFASAPRGRSCAFSQISITLPTKPRKYTTIRCTTGDASAEATIATETETESDSSPIELPKESFPSLISALNVERALRGIPITDADHYGRLGIPKGCSSDGDQVYSAYKNKVEELMNEGLGKEELGKKLELLKESYTILSNAEERRLYDWSLARSEKPDTYVWPFEVDSTKTTTEFPPPQEPEDVRPTRWLGYFMFGWLILAFTMSIVLNR